MRRHLGVGFRRKLVALRLEFILDFLEILDDPVVDDSDAITGYVRMRIRLGYPAVSRPARMRDTQQAA